jgi:transketolase C-terminal domain/subunit
MITEIESEKISQFHKQSKDSVYQSISLQAWYLDSDKKTELTTYYEVSTKNTVSKAIQTTDLDIYRTELLAKKSAN